MSHSLNEKARPYPVVANHIVADPTPKDQAVYIPSVSSGYAMDVHAGRFNRPLPAGITASMLNFLDPANQPFFSLSHVLSSAGQALSQPRDCIITTRDRRTSTLVCDSGGYQIASNRLKISGQSDIIAILRWMEQHGDYAMTLDVPTGPLSRNPGGYAYKTFRDCLDKTLEYLTVFRSSRVNGELKLLNVLQGNTPEQADLWYDAVKQFDFEGWAFAGLLRHNLKQLCRGILIMRDEGQIQNKRWIHVLGTSDLETAVLLTALQRSINRYINPDLRISYDTSTPFRALRAKSVFSFPTFANRSLLMPMRSAPDSHRYIGSSLRFPWPSPIGDLLTLGDICVKTADTAASCHDLLSSHLLSHHNLTALCSGIAVANRVFDSESIERKHTIAQHVGAAVEAIDEVLASGQLGTLQKHDATFAALRHNKVYEDGDELRL